MLCLTMKRAKTVEEPLWQGDTIYNAHFYIVDDNTTTIGSNMIITCFLCFYKVYVANVRVLDMQTKY